MTPAPAFPRHDEQGFTLVEMLVVMVLLSLLTLGLGAALSTVSSTSTRVDARLERLEQQRAARALLRSTIANLSGQMRQGDLRRQGQNPLFFDGRANSLQWLASMPARVGLGGLTHFRLTLQEGDLVLQLAPWRGPDQAPDWSRGLRQVLERGVTSLALRYQSARLGTDNWQDSWPPTGPGRRRDELPSAIQILVGGEPGWPLTVVALHAPAVTNPESGGRGATAGG